MHIKPTNEYEHGQMMGMLVIIELFNKARERNGSISQMTLDNISKIAVADLSQYFEQPEEDIYLLIDKELEEIS